MGTAKIEPPRFTCHAAEAIYGSRDGSSKHHVALNSDIDKPVKTPSATMR